MVTRDPAIEAARRAKVRRPLASSVAQIDAAREALAPIRARHQPRHQCGGPAWCAYDGIDWPCPDALDAYTTTELENPDD